MNDPVQLFDQETVVYQQPSALQGSVSAPPASPAGPRDRFTDLQMRWLDAFCGDDPEVRGNGEAAAIAAGYAPESAKNSAFRNLLKPHIQDEIERRVKAMKGSALLAAMTRAMKIIEHSKDDAAAARVLLGLMDRLGMAPPRGPSVNVNVTTGIDGAAAFSILAQVVQAREQRLKQVGPPHVSGIAGDMPDKLGPVVEG